MKNFTKIKVLLILFLSRSLLGNFVLVGPTGSGKSTLINIIAGKYIADFGSSTNSVTAKFSIYELDNIKFVDTIGIDDTSSKSSLAGTTIALLDIFEAIYEMKEVSAFVYLLPCSETRISEQSNKFLKMLVNFEILNIPLILFRSKCFNKQCHCNVPDDLNLINFVDILYSYTNEKNEINYQDPIKHSDLVRTKGQFRNFYSKNPKKKIELPSNYVEMIKNGDMMHLIKKMKEKRCDDIYNLKNSLISEINKKNSIECKRRSVDVEQCKITSRVYVGEDCDGFWIFEDCDPVFQTQTSIDESCLALKKQEVNDAYNDCLKNSEKIIFQIENLEKQMKTLDDDIKTCDQYYNSVKDEL